MRKTTIEEQIKTDGYHMATIVGDSMMPMLRNRTDIVKVVPVNGILKKYDLPLYKRPTGEYVLHRIIKVKKGYYITCGDNRFNQEKVPFQWIIGVMESFEKDGITTNKDDVDYIKYIKNVRKTFWIRRIKRRIERWKRR